MKIKLVKQNTKLLKSQVNFYLKCYLYFSVLAFSGCVLLGPQRSLESEHYIDSQPRVLLAVGKMQQYRNINVNILSIALLLLENKTMHHRHFDLNVYVYF